MNYTWNVNFYNQICKFDIFYEFFKAPWFKSMQES
jgi:hypothetical protein